MKKILLFSLLLAVCGLVWFLFIKKYDYQFHFKSKAGKAAVYQEIKNGESLGILHESGVINTKEETPFSHLVQNYTFGDTTISFAWNFKYENDSVTTVEVKTLDNHNSLRNRMAILNPFQRSQNLNNMVSKMEALKQHLDAKQKIYNIRFKGIVSSPQANCICTESTDIRIDQKANEMLQTIEIIESYFVENELKLQGFPFLKVTEWNLEDEKINFDFCFPIGSAKGLQETPFVKIKNFSARESLTGIFHGNYKLSHLAWYELLEKAKRENISIEAKPMEVYYNNPRMGETAIDWKSEIFMPLQEK